MRSPPLGMEGRQWLGITVPPKSAKFRNQMVSLRLAAYPRSNDHAQVIFQCEIYDPWTSGVNWIIVFFWQTIATRVMPMIMKMQSRFAGSQLERQYNASDEQSAAVREAMLGVRVNID